MRALLLAAWLLVACGSEILRPLEIDVLGLSARAEVFVLKVVPGGQIDCASVSLDSVRGIEAELVTRWVRSEGQARSAELPVVEEGAVTVIAHAEDAGGAVIQYACQRLSFEDIADLPTGALELTLSRRAP